MKLYELVKVLGVQDIDLIVENEENGLIDSESFYYDKDGIHDVLEKYKDYNVTYVHGWDYDEIRIFISDK